ncbi:MAG: NirA family protein [Tepidisphaeraceae bacterium]
MTDDFTDEQKQYLHGFAAGSGLSSRLSSVPTFARTLGLAPASTGPRPIEQICYDAQDATTSAGGKLTNEEQAKRKRFPLNQWDDIVRHSRENVPPKGTDVLAFKYFGLFWVAPAQDSFMSRLRFAGGIVKAYQFRGVADLARRFGGGYSDVTTRANLQVRQIEPKNGQAFLEGLYELGIVNKGSGADNVRNITASPLAGIDPDELYDTRELAKQLNHHILNHRELFGLPRKFNIALDGGGRISALEDTNDIGLSAIRFSGTKAHGAVVGLDAQVGFRLALGGITGHKDFARDTGIVVLPDEVVNVCTAILKAFIEHGDRTDRKKARLKYVLERLGFGGFLSEVEKHYGQPLRRVPSEQIVPHTPAVQKHGHVGWRDQAQPGLQYAGVVLPVGRLSSEQMERIASIAERYGSGMIRLTVWQNLILSDIRPTDREAVERELAEIGLTTDATSVRAGLVACTGNAGCKFANANTKKHAMEIAGHLERVLALDEPVNIHVTGCPNSCAQHYIGDIGLLGTKVPVGDDMVEGYHVYVGGGYGDDRAIGRELVRNVVATDAPDVLARLLGGFLSQRMSGESFNAFVRRHEIVQLQSLLNPTEVPA